MSLKITVGKPKKRVFGNEYPVKFFKGKKLLHKTHMFGNDLKYADRGYTREFVGTKLTRLWGKRKRKSSKRRKK